VGQKIIFWKIAQILGQKILLSAPKSSLGWGDFAVLNSDKTLLGFSAIFAVNCL
jgi:hypothetical protein